MDPGHPPLEGGTDCHKMLPKARVGDHSPVSHSHSHTRRKGGAARATPPSQQRQNKLTPVNPSETHPDPKESTQSLEESPSLSLPPQGGWPNPPPPGQRTPFSKGGGLGRPPRGMNTPEIEYPMGGYGLAVPLYP